MIKPAILALGLAALGAASAASADPLAAYAWRARPVVVFAPSADDAGFQEQLRRFEAERAALQARAMPIIAVAGDNVREDGAASALSASQLRARAGVETGAVAVALFGKDGGLKLQRAAPIAPGELFELVDAMPMRRREMRAAQPD